MTPIDLSSNPLPLALSASLSLQMLREELPEWSWRAVRVGLGWRYEGHRGEARATIRACAVVCGPSDFSKRWVVYETGETYASWYCREVARLKAEGARQ